MRRRSRQPILVLLTLLALLLVGLGLTWLLLRPAPPTTSSAPSLPGTSGGRLPVPGPVDEARFDALAPGARAQAGEAVLELHGVKPIATPPREAPPDPDRPFVPSLPPPPGSRGPLSLRPRNVSTVSSAYCRSPTAR